VRPRVIPVQFFLARVVGTAVLGGLREWGLNKGGMTSRYFVTIRFNNSLPKIQQFVDAQYTIVIEGD
jgi:hypothetical protein